MENRIIKIFISSTFREMIKERDEIQQIAFSKLRFWGKSLGLQIVPIDLRWGITEKDIMSGKLAKICGDAVEGCIPYFLALLGNTYGTDDRDAMGELYKDYKGKSITDYEIRKGVLEISNTKALIYNITYSTQKESIIKSLKVASLKKELQKQVGLIDINLHERLIKTVVGDLQALILSNIEREYTMSKAQKHFFAIKSCYFSQYYNDYFHDEYVAKYNALFERSGCFVIKAQEPDAISMLMYNLAFSKRMTRSLYHDFQMPEYSRDKNGLIRHILDEISETTGRYFHVSDSLEQDLYTVLSSEQDIYIFIDSLHLLETKKADAIMNVVCANCFDNVRFIVSCYSGIEYFRNQYTEIQVEDFHTEEASKYIRSYLEEYKKNTNMELTNQIVQHILDIKGRSAVFLQLLMSEILMKGCPSDRIIEEIDKYKSVYDIDDLVKLILERIIKMHEVKNELKGIIKTICLSLYLSKGYLKTEDLYAIGKVAGYQKENITEVLELIGDFLTICENKCQFRFLSFRNAIKGIFCKQIEDFDDNVFFPYFNSLGESVYVIYEICQYFVRHQRIEELVETILKPSKFCRVFYEKQEVLFDYAKSYADLFVEKIKIQLQVNIYDDEDYLRCLFEFLDFIGELEIALQVIDKIEALFGKSSKWGLEKARIYRAKANYNYASEILLDIVQNDETEEMETLIKAYDYLSYCQGKMGKFEESIKNSKKAIKLRNYNLDKYEIDLPISLNSLAYNYFACEDYEEAIKLYEKSRQLRIKYFGTNHPRVASNMNNIGEIYIRQGRYQEAISVFEESLKILRKTLSSKHMFYFMCQTNWLKSKMLINAKKGNLDYGILKEELDAVRAGLLSAMGESDYTKKVDVLLGICAYEMGDMNEGDKYLSGAYDFFLEFLGENSYECKEIFNLQSRYVECERI